MDDALFMGRLERLRDVGREPDRLVHGKLMLTIELPPDLRRE